MSIGISPFCAFKPVLLSCLVQLLSAGRATMVTEDAAGHVTKSVEEPLVERVRMLHALLP